MVIDLAFLPESKRLVNMLTGESVATDALRQLPLARVMTDFPAALPAYGKQAGQPNTDPTGESRVKISS